MELKRGPMKRESYLHSFRISKEYKDKLRELNQNGIMVGKTIAPALYMAIDAAIAELKGKK